MAAGDRYGGGRFSARWWGEVGEATPWRIFGTLVLASPQAGISQLSDKKNLNPNNNNNRRGSSNLDYTSAALSFWAKHQPSNQYRSKYIYHFLLS